MIDRNKLNRIQGVLSARLGAEIPKFSGGAKFTRYKGTLAIYSNDGVSWFWDPEMSSFFNGDINEFKNYSNFEVKGAPDVTPDTSLENAKKLIAKTEELKQDIISEVSANTSEDVADVVNKTLAYPHLDSLNAYNPASIKVASAQDAVLNKLEIPEHLRVLIKDSLKDIFEKIQKEKRRDKLVGQVGEYATQGLQAVGDAFGAAQSVTDSSTTKTADALYDLTSEIVKKMGPVGLVVGTAMGFAGTAGDIIQGLGGGTDQMTGTDKWMDSSFFSWNVGMINGFGGKKSDAFAADQDILANVGSSYGGTTEDINNAAAKASKKYGLFSSGARRKANRQIAAARAKLNLMGDISEEATDLRLNVQSMGELAGLAYSLMTDGGYNLKYTYAAKHGGLLEWNPTIELEWEPQIELNWELSEFKEGGSVEINEELEQIPSKLSFDEWFNSIPKDSRASGYDYKKAYEVFDWETLYKHTKDPEKYHLYSVSPIADENGNYPFLKLGKLEENPELKGEFDWYNSEEGKEHKAKFDILYIGDRYYYVPKKFKNGGKTEESDIPEIEETTLKNVIPEGALHKNKHHMEHAEGLTKKGIPVIDEDGELQAEIEHSEIIFTLEVTKKLEEYYDIFYSEESSNKEKEQAALDAGKLLVYQILENTEDRTGLIESCKKGGSLKFKTSTDDLIKEVLEWMPTILVIEEEEIKEEKPKEDKKKSEKELMKEAIKEVLIELLTK